MIAIVCASRRAVAALLLAAAASGVPAFAQQRVGVSGAVNQDATAIPPGAAARRLVIGQDIVYNERITTTAAGQTQVLFVDQSALSVGPDSDITIDRFVFDPNAGTGQLAMTAARGVMRFVGGQLSKADNAVTLNTATATIGIRGGVFMMDLAASGKLQVVFLYGRGLTVTGHPGCAQQSITRPGYEISVDGPSACPTAPFPAPAGTTAALLAALDGHPGANGGAAQIPTDPTIVESGIANTISANFGASLQAAAQNPPRTQPPELDIGALQTTLQVNTARSQSGLPPNNNRSPPPTPPVPPTPVVITVAGAAIGTGLGAGGQSGSTPYANGTITYEPGTAQNGVFAAIIGGQGITLSPLNPGITNPVTGQNSVGHTATGTVFTTADNSFFFADLTSTTDPSEVDLIYGGVPVGSGFLQATSTAPQFSAYTIHPDAALQSGIPFIEQATGGSLAAASVSPLYLATPANTVFAPSLSAGSVALTKALQASLAISGQGAAQQSVIVVAVGNAFTTSLNGTSPAAPVIDGNLNGSYMASATGQPVRINSALLTGSDGNGVSLYGNSTGITGFVLDQNNCCSSGGGQIGATAGTTDTGTLLTTAYQFAQPATVTALPANFSTAQTTQTLSGYFGGTMFAQPAGVPYVLAGTATISTDATNLQLAATFTGSDPFTSETSGVNSATLQFGTLSTGNTAARQAFINDSLFAALESPDAASQINGISAVDSSGNPLGASHIYMVNANVVPNATAAILPSGVSVCACQYLQWGYWGGEVDTPAGGDSPARRDIGNINTWIAGQPTVNLPTTGNAMFSGAAIGTVNNNGASYLAAGSFTGNYNFATRGGNVFINNFDGNNFRSIVAPSGGATYQGTLAGTGTTPFTGSVSGTFYGPLAQETGGNFTAEALRGTPYIASGIFAGKQ